MNNNQMPESLFGLLVLSLGNAALVGMGIVPAPETNKKSINLDTARSNIEILTMLQEKTRGNLSAEEDNLIGELLYDLRLKFVEASKAIC